MFPWGNTSPGFSYAPLLLHVFCGPERKLSTKTGDFGVKNEYSVQFFFKVTHCKTQVFSSFSVELNKSYDFT